MKHYRHLTGRDRAKISKMKSYGWSYSKIARKIGVDKSTISREIRRNGEITDRDIGFWKKLYEDIGLSEMFEQVYGNKTSEKFLSYVCANAEQQAQEMKLRSAMRSKIDSQTRSWVVEKLKDGWTPDQVAGRSKRDLGKSISHESIYQLVIKDKKNGGNLYRLLPRFKKRKRRLSNRDYRKVLIPHRVGIEKRPTLIEKRERLGDLEGDLIIGSYQKSFLITVVDRVSRQVAIVRTKQRNKESVLNGLVTAIKRFPVALTLTLDNAREFSCHTDLTRLTGVRVYFSNPYSSYERGTVENTNGLIRRTYPKKTDFRKITDRNVQELEQKLNSTPRRILNYLTAAEVAFRCSKQIR